MCSSQPHTDEKEALVGHSNAPLTPEGRRRLCERVDAGRAICHVAGKPGSHVRRWASGTSGGSAKANRAWWIAPAVLSAPPTRPPCTSRIGSRRFVANESSDRCSSWGCSREKGSRSRPRPSTGSWYAGGSLGSGTSTSRVRICANRWSATNGPDLVTWSTSRQEAGADPFGRRPSRPRPHLGPVPSHETSQDRWSSGRLRLLALRPGRSFPPDLHRGAARRARIDRCGVLGPSGEVLPSPRDRPDPPGAERQRRLLPIEGVRVGAACEP